MNEMNFSVSICVYGKDSPEHFDVALESIVDQTLAPTEIVLTVDGPIPEAMEKIIAKYRERLENSRIGFKIIRLEKNMGHGEARRVCFENCSCQLIALMDADDLSVPDRFEKQIKYCLDNPEVSAVGGNITEFISADDPRDTSRKAGSRKVPEDDAGVKRFMRKRCPMNQMTVMFRKDDVAEVGGYVDWYCDEDYYLWIRLALAGKRFGNIPSDLVNVRVGTEMYRRRGGLKYFMSEYKLQKLMLAKGITGWFRFFINVAERFILQVLMPNRIRGWLFQKLARS